MSNSGAERLKQLAALKAVESIRDGMVVGLGSGSTSAFAIEAMGEKVKQGLKIIGIATSKKSAQLAKQAGIMLSDLETHPLIDVTIDGADEVESDTLYLIKGLGGALLREKITALASRKVIIIVDDSKVTAKLGTKAPIPVEVAPFGWNTTAERLAAVIGGSARIVLRNTEDKKPFVTDGGNYILDCHVGAITDAPCLEMLIAQTVGVIESGLFTNIASEVVVASTAGVSVLGKSLSKA
jgi:ribose 5-phosphate isomerase A